MVNYLQFAEFTQLSSDKIYCYTIYSLLVQYPGSILFGWHLQASQFYIYACNRTLVNHFTVVCAYALYVGPMKLDSQFLVTAFMLL